MVWIYGGGFFSGAGSEPRYHGEGSGLWHVRKLAQLQAEQGNDAYVYYFTRVPPAPPGRPSRGATHVAEIAYVFDNLAEGTPWTATDRELADTMSQYWVNFAASGNPNGPGLPA